MMNSAFSRRILLLILFFFIALLFSISSSAVHADSASFYLSMESVLAMLKRNQDLIIVDVRHKEAFDTTRIAGSIHLPLHALKAKSFLKSKPSVLVAQGYPDRELENACRSLREAGFERVFILRGGINAWQEQKGPMEGGITRCAGCP